MIKISAREGYNNRGNTDVHSLPPYFGIFMLFSAQREW
ncbi:hypothetical Protein YC6258_05512 [Gynuella sunshinyii YC6258]|uniref:Uncharacterized protein n=1 Tax=Gynuella sunshinyii YC6258 TaxID=1445510 RepID=A0A0C5VTN1_9GAMM|nr:hypothetical Protein YC6258_05512 [Gynuella sunshinyii YC6258]